MLNDEFIQNASKYRSELIAAKSFEEIHHLWQSTSMPYKISEKDPKSAAYKKEVLSIYESLACISYSTQNEMTSTLMTSAEEFELGWPWGSKNLTIISQETAKVAQAIKALNDAGVSGKRIIEFGSGWGNLAVPMAKSGQDVTVVDIDRRFLERIGRICQKERITITRIESEFLEACRKVDGKFDAVIFQASFHHCLDFDNLLYQIKNKLLTDTGSIFFFSEPVFDGYAFPWGIRYDGESLWAVMCNKWLELGFDQSFFSDVLLSQGFFLSRVQEIPGYVGSGWRATQSVNGINFSEWVLPGEYDRTFHKLDNSGLEGRFCKRESVLPALSDKAANAYCIRLRNYGPRPLRFTITSGQTVIHKSIDGGVESEVWAISYGEEVRIKSDTFYPYKAIMGNKDTRELGIYIARVSTGRPGKPTSDVKDKQIRLPGIWDRVRANVAMSGRRAALRLKKALRGSP